MDRYEIVAGCEWMRLDIIDHAKGDYVVAKISGDSEVAVDALKTLVRLANIANEEEECKRIMAEMNG